MQLYQMKMHQKNQYSRDSDSEMAQGVNVLTLKPEKEFGRNLTN